MPFNNNTELPEEVKNALPVAAQTIWRSAYNSAYYGPCDSDESCAAAVAWKAVKTKYEKTPNGTWTEKELFVIKVTKREGGEDFPAEAFAYTPDLTQPSTWKLRLWDSLAEKETPAQVGRAIAAIGKGFRGERVDLPASAIPQVKAKIRQAWKKVHDDSDELPDVLKQVEELHVEMVPDGLVVSYSGDSVGIDHDLFKGATSDLYESERIFVIRYPEGFLTRADGRAIGYLHTQTDELPDWTEKADILFAPAEIAILYDDIVPNLGDGTIMRPASMESVEVDKELNEQLRTIHPDFLAAAALEMDIDPDDIYKQNIEVHENPLSGNYAYSVSKSHEENRFTYGPLYVPDTLDAHDEFIEASELEKAVWWYVQNASRTINLQHRPNTVAGEWVELTVWRHPHETDLMLPERGLVKRKFPPGTAYMGVIWEPESWQLVKEGKLRGLSIEGFANRIEADFEGDDESRRDRGPIVLPSRRDF